LSLATSCHIVDMMAGTLGVDTGKGSSSGAGASADTAPVAAPALRRGRVLIVDDEPVLANSMRRVVAIEHEVVVVNRADDALRLVTEGKRFDLILSDLMMPGMTGMELFAQLQRAAPDQAQAMVFMTGGAFTPQSRAFLDEVPNPRLEKPFDAMRVVGMVTERIR
jgi:CheY-like chemotaxis protein